MSFKANAGTDQDLALISQLKLILKKGKYKNWSTTFMPETSIGDGYLHIISSNTFGIIGTLDSNITGLFIFSRCCIMS